MKSALLLVTLAACDPVWGVDVKLRDPATRPVESATVAIACPDGRTYPSSRLATRTTEGGEASVGGLGDEFPVGCDVYVAKPGYHTRAIRYHELCPNGPRSCDRVFWFDLVLEPE